MLNRKIMSEQNFWIDSQAEELNGGTQSSQDTVCSQDVAGYENENQDTAMFHESIQTNEDISLPYGDNALHRLSDSFQGSYSQNLTTGHELLDSAVSGRSVYINEDTQMMGSESLHGFLTTESPYDIASPGCEPGDISSPFEAMESDGLNDADDSMFSTSSTSMRRRFQNICQQGTVSTTTPGGSSDEDPYSSSGSRKKRRRTKKEMHPSLNFTQDRFQHYSTGSQIPSPVPAFDALANGKDQTNISQGVNLASHHVNPQTIANTSDPNLFNTILKANRRLSNASESNLSSMTCTIENNSGTDSSMFSRPVAGNLDDGDSSTSKPAQVKKSYGNDYRDPKYRSSALLPLQAVYPSSSHGCSLNILAQPEEQHRARYLTEGSRGPVKDSSQQDYPQIQLKGYTGKTTLSVFVGSDTDDKVRPHGFYQACKVTGRNTTPCEEVEMEGTKIILIPFDAQEAISVDCVGILKLRNADVEFRIGANRAKKRSQTVRLVFRVALDNLTGFDKQNPCILQVVSHRINCTQPRGQPEITKKSLERCSVEGNQEMFIIGRNFHKGTKVIFQDSEEPDGSHWHASGSIDKDTFNQSHLVVRIPPYHDQAITKSVNVQLCVEFNGRKCDPHSFTYDPTPKVAQKEVTSELEGKKPTENALKDILDKAKIDRKVLEALFAQLLRPGAPDDESKHVKPTVSESSHGNPTSFEKPSIVPMMNDPEQQSNVQLMAFSAGCTPSSTCNVSIQSTPTLSATSKAMTNNASVAFSKDPVAMTSEQSNPDQLPTVTSGTPAMQNVPVTFFPAQQQQNSAQTPMPAMPLDSTSPKQNMIVKTESAILNIWPDEQVSFPLCAEQIQQRQPKCGSFPLQQHAPASMSDVLFSLSQPTNHVTAHDQAFPVSVNQPSRSLPAMATEANQSVVPGAPQPASALGQEMSSSNSTFAPAPTSQWSGQMEEAASGLAFSENITAQVSSSVFENAFSVQQVMVTQTAVATSGFNSQNTPVSCVSTQPQLMVVSHNRPSDTSLTSSNINTAPVQHTDALQWHMAEQQVTNITCDTFHNENNLSGVQLQHSNLEELTFNRTSGQPAISGDLQQQQLFTLGHSMEIMNPPKSSDSSTRNLTQESTSFQNILVPPNNVTEVVPTLDQVNMNMIGTLNPTTAIGDTGLSIGFHNNFSLNDSDMLLPSKVIDNSVLQTIISDCTNGSFITSNDSTERDLLDHKLQGSLPQSDLNQNLSAPVPGTLNTSTVNKDLNISGTSLQATSQFTSSLDLEMVSAVQMEEKPFEPQAQSFDEFMAQPMVNTNLYLVNPSCVGPSSQQVAEAGIEDSSAPLVAANLPTSQNQQVEVLTSMPNIKQVNASNSFSTIDSSSVNFSTGNSNGLDQAITGFNQNPTSNGGT